ncbi:MAG: SusC/RagA family TonB-linked outer membrane protein, partial [Muribaculaceae bacterium]|nr:SusC/RagA family TonB-linked outer membrane protein [Muribaculaceae bacterium]
NPLEAINGRVAGISVQSAGNGMATMNAVRVRGTTSLTGGNDPLIIIDGVMGDLSTLAGLYLADIESFNVLKDASETAQYGARGASGVIEVTTKRGSGSHTQVTYNGSVGFTHVAKNLDMLSANDYRQQLQQRGLMLIDKGFNTNWQREIEHTGLLHDHHIAFMGGGDNNGYRVSLGYMDHEGIILHDRMRNFTSNLSMHQTMFNGLLKIDVGMFGNILKEKTAVYDVQKTFYSAATWNPTYGTERNAAGQWDGFTYANQINHPLALMDSRTSDKTSHLSTHAKLSFMPGHGWTVSLFGAYSYSDTETSQYLPTSIWAHGQAFRNTRKTESLLGNVVATWNRTFNQHHFNIMGMAEVQRESFTGFHTTTTNFSDNALGYDAIQAGALTLWDGTASFRETPSMASFMGRVAYDLLDRYSFSVTARADASSRFGKNHKWGYFPSVSAAWTVSKEPFMQSIQWLDNLKVRTGYGLAGNQGGIDSYMSMNALMPGGIIPVGEQAAVALIKPKNVNPDLKWEVKRTFNVGLDMSFLHERIFGTVEFYTSKTSDMLYLYNVAVPPFQYNKLLANLGTMRNSGVEVSLGAMPISSRDWDLRINVNAAWQRNKLLSLSGYLNNYYLEVPTHVDIANLNGAGFHGGNNHIVYQVIGQPLGVFYLPHCTGLESDGNGGYTYAIADLNDDHTTDVATDRRVCGQAVPKVLMGSNISLRFKHCDLTVQANGAFGHKIYNGTALTYMNMNSLPGYNVLADAPRHNIKDQTATDYWLESGDYLNIDYVTLGWNVPVHSRFIDRLRLSATISNLTTFTAYSGLTPMINSTNINGTLGVDDKNIYPVARTYTLSLSITF